MAELVTEFLVRERTATRRPLAARPRAEHAERGSRSTTTDARHRTASSPRAPTRSRRRSRERGPPPRRPRRDAHRQHARSTSWCSSPARRLGLILLPLSWRLVAGRARYQLEDAEPSLFLVEDGVRRARRAQPDRPSSGSPSRRGRAPGRVRRATSTDEDGLLLIYTSGTTGKPKGALLTHANCFWTNLSFDLATGVSSDDVVLQVLPQFHVGGWNVQTLLAWWKGATVILERAVRRRPRAAADRGEAGHDDDGGAARSTWFIAQQPGFADADLSSLERAVVGGAPMPEALLETWAAPRHRDRPGLRADRGGAERALPAARGRRAQARLRRQAVPVRRGRLSPTRRAAGASGPNVFAGYWRNAEATAPAFTDDGWLRTGDVAERGRRGLLPDQGPPQGHVHLGRRERLPGRGGGRAARASARRGRRRRRRAGRALGRGRRRVRRRATARRRAES